MSMEERTEDARAAAMGALARAGAQDALVDALADSAFICDQDGRIVRMNAAYRILLGLSEEDERLYGAYSLAQRTERQYMRDADGNALPYDDIPVMRLLRGEVIPGAEPVEVYLRTWDGSDLLLSFSGAPLYDGDGALIGCVCICRDVTESRKLERRTQDALDALLAMASILVESDALDEGRGEPRQAAATQQLVALTQRVLGCQRVAVTAHNAQSGVATPIAAVGLTPDEEDAWRGGRPGMTLREFLSPQQAERLDRDDVLVVESEDRRALPYGASTLLLTLMRVGGTIVGVVSLDYGPAAHEYTREEIALAQGVGRLTGFVLERERLMRERAEARASALALSEANRRMDLFLGMASHELKTPITTIVGNIQLAQRRLDRLAANGDATAETMLGPLLERTRHSTLRINQLVDDLLDTTVIQEDRLRLHRAPHDLALLVATVVDEQRNTEHGRAIEYKHPTGDPVPVVLDEARVEQVVLNYLTNALKYAPAEKPIVVGVAVNAGVARFWVQDEGPGLSPDAAAHVWDRFYQVDGVERLQGSRVGLGLGLYISKTIVEAHGGAVGVEEAPGGGALFWFTLPLTSPNGKDGPSSTTAATSSIPAEA